MNELPRGIIPPIAVPFDNHGSLDERLLRLEMRFLNRCGVHGISTGGSTGEGALLTEDEIVRCVEVVQEEKNKTLPIIAGIIRNSTREVIAIATKLKGLAVDALLITPPFYYGASPESNYEFYAEIAKAINIPIIVYNVVPANVIQPEMFIRLLNIEGIVGIKQVNPVIHAETVALYDGRCTAYTYSACDFMLYSTYVAGSDGAISALATIAPKLCVKQWNAFLQGDQKTASEIQRRLLPVVQCYQKQPFPGRVKTLLRLQGRDLGIARMPNLMPQEAEIDQMRHIMAEAELLS